MPHIKVELDFIPVEERLPDTTCPVFLLEKWEEGIGTGWYRKTWIGHDAFYEAIVPENVTHWAEIPKLDSRE